MVPDPFSNHRGNGALRWTWPLGQLCYDWGHVFAKPGRFSSAQTIIFVIICSFGSHSGAWVGPCVGFPSAGIKGVHYTRQGSILILCVLMLSNVKGDRSTGTPTKGLEMA